MALTQKMPAFCFDSPSLRHGLEHASRQKSRVRVEFILYVPLRTSNEFSTVPYPDSELLIVGELI